MADDLGGLCVRCGRTYIVEACSGCGVRLTHLHAAAGTPCGDCLAAKLWQRIPAQVRAVFDEHVAADSLIQAVVTLREESGLPVSLQQAQDVFAWRRKQLHAAGQIPPPAPPVTLADLITTTQALPTRPVAIEASWDGDTQGWFVILSAVLDRPGPSHPDFDSIDIATLRQGGDLRLFNGAVPPWPEVRQAAGLGKALAAHCGVPFLPAPEEPDIGQPRWWDTVTPRDEPPHH